jgi:hypothetical protein
MTRPAFRVTARPGAPTTRAAVRPGPEGAMIHPYASDQPEASRTPS